MQFRTKRAKHVIIPPKKMLSLSIHSAQPAHMKKSA